MLKILLKFRQRQNKIAGAACTVLESSWILTTPTTFSPL